MKKHPRIVCAGFTPLFLLFAVLLLTPAPSAALDEVAWMEVEFPPGYIHKGPLRGQGYEDVITRILMEHLTEYRHDKMMGNLARMYHEFRQGRRVCNVALFKTPERREFMYFSIPSTFTLPNGLITLRKRLPEFGDASEISRPAPRPPGGPRSSGGSTRSSGKNGPRSDTGPPTSGGWTTTGFPDTGNSTIRSF